MSEAGSDPVVFLSNRGPVEYGRSGGERTTRRGGGGLVTALSGLAGRLDDAVWVCGRAADEDAVVAGEHDGALTLRVPHLNPWPGRAWWRARAWSLPPEPSSGCRPSDGNPRTGPDPD